MKLQDLMDSGYLKQGTIIRSLKRGKSMSFGDVVYEDDMKVTDWEVIKND